MSGLIIYQSMNAGQCVNSFTLLYYCCKWSSCGRSLVTPQQDFNWLNPFPYLSLVRPQDVYLQQWQRQNGTLHVNMRIICTLELCYHEEETKLKIRAVNAVWSFINCLSFWPDNATWLSEHFNMLANCRKTNVARAGQHNCWSRAVVNVRARHKSTASWLRFCLIHPLRWVFHCQGPLLPAQFLPSLTCNMNVIFVYFFDSCFVSLLISMLIFL